MGIRLEQIEKNVLYGSRNCYLIYNQETNKLKELCEGANFCVTKESGLEMERLRRDYKATLR